MPPMRSESACTARKRQDRGILPELPDEVHTPLLAATLWLTLIRKDLLLTLNTAEFVCLLESDILSKRDITKKMEDL